MHGRQFDDLAKAMAAGMSRRKAISGLFGERHGRARAGQLLAAPDNDEKCKIQSQSCGQDVDCCQGKCCNHRCCWINAICGEDGECAFPPPEPPPVPTEPGDECMPIAGCDGPGCPEGCFCTVVRDTANTTVNRCMKATGFTKCSDEVCTSSEECDKGFCVLDECGLCNPRACVENLIPCPHL